MNIFLVALAIATLAISHISYVTTTSEILCNGKEEQSLLSFKAGLVDPSNRLASWIGGRSCCDWAGVVCHNLTGHVLELHLEGNVTCPSPEDVGYQYNYKYEDLLAAYERSSLGGNIGNSLLDLRHLRYLDLSNNDFQYGKIPGFFGSMKSLRLLNLSCSGFAGMVPPQLGNLSNLVYLNIGFNELDVENLDWLSGFSMLKHLDMNNVDLDRASDWVQQISALPSLKELHLGDCGLSDALQLPNKNLSRLENLDLSRNDFNSSYSFLEMFHSLVSLDISGNGISGPLPIVVQNLTSLRHLDLSSNYVNSLLPDRICYLSQLEKLILGDNIFQGILSNGIGNVSSLKYLDLSYNKLHGIIPASFGQLFQLEYLNLFGNSFQGTMSEAVFSNLKRLEYLNLCGNSFQGTMSEAFFSNLTRLEVLALSRNQITWRANHDWVPPFQLIRLELSSLQLGPEFPEWLRSQNRLSYLELAGTGIKDRVPTWLWDRSSQFLYINLTSNNLYGTISDVILSARFMDLSSNNFEGLLPSVSGKVFALDFSNNSFSGPVSTLLCQKKDAHKKLQAMILGNNQLSGEIPDCWTGWQDLVFVDMRENFFTGNVPGSIGSLCKLQKLLLSDNSLSGVVPRFLQNGSSMEILDLAHNLLIGPVLQNICNDVSIPSMGLLMLGNNQLSGNIPDCWKSWPNLRRLELQENEFTGHLPDSIGSLNILEWMHLQKNNLSGELPSSLQNCKSLKILDIGENKFRGRLPKWLGESFIDIMIMRLRSNNFVGIIPNEMCGLHSLHTLDIANNNLFGYIPKCIFNLYFMAHGSGTLFLDPYSTPFEFTIGPFSGKFIFRKDSANLVSKGSSREYTSILEYAVFLDLSNNRLSGHIPEEITNLSALMSLNLSSNMLTGRIPKNMGNMTSLESVDLSCNRLSGEIPLSMAAMTTLNFLNLSYNNLTGTIPVSTQFSTFSQSSFLGNNLSVSNNNNSSKNGSILSSHDHHWVEFNEMYASAVVGFVVGFGIVVAPLLYIRSWRLVFFRIIGNILDKLWELIVLPIRVRFRRKV